MYPIIRHIVAFFIVAAAAGCSLHLRTTSAPTTACPGCGYDWVLREGRCVVEKFCGCRDEGRKTFRNQRTCVEQHGVGTLDLKYLPVGSACPAFPTPPGFPNPMGHADAPRDGHSACADFGVAEGAACTGNGGTGCQGDECKRMEPAFCGAAGKILGCRPAAFACTL